MSENKTNMDDIFIKTTNINSIKSCEGKDENNFDVWSRETKPRDFRFIILSLGITGSGKSSAIRKAKELASLINPIAYRNSWVTEEISHDNIVTNNKNYKTCFDDLGINIENLISKLENNTISDDPELLGIHEKLEQCYFKYRMNNGEFSTTRREYGFSGKTKRYKMSQPQEKIKRDDSDDKIKQKWKTSDIGKTLQEHEFEEFVRPRVAYHKYPEKVFNSDITVYRRITDAINAKKNIVYEATGKKYETIKKIIELAARNCKVKKENLKHAKYIIITTLNIIDPVKASERIKERFLQDLKNYNINKKNNPAPRLPTFNIKKLTDINEKIYSNVEKLIQHCKCVYNSGSGRYIWNDNENKFCEGVGIDYLLFYNQNDGDFRKKNTYASVVVPLSERSKYLTKLTSNKNIEFNKNDKNKLTLLMNKNICLHNETNKKKKLYIDERIKLANVSNPDKLTQTFGSANLAYAEKMRKLKNMRRRGATTTELTIGDITRQIKNKTKKRGGKQKIKKRKTHKKQKTQQKRKSHRKRKTHKKLK